MTNTKIENMTKDELTYKAYGAINTYLSRKGYEDLEIDDLASCILAHDVDNDCKVFIRITVDTDFESGIIKNEEVDRDWFEQLLVFYAAFEDLEDTKVRCDHLTLKILKNSKAIIRHHINCLGN